jgi:hypothetical protein
MLLTEYFVDVMQENVQMKHGNALENNPTLNLGFSMFFDFLDQKTALEKLHDIRFSENRPQISSWFEINFYF